MGFYSAHSDGHICFPQGNWTLLIQKECKAHLKGRGGIGLQSFISQRAFRRRDLSVAFLSLVNAKLRSP